MAKRLSDTAVARLRRKAEQGADHADLASEFAITRRHVDRIVRGDQRRTIPAQDGPALGAVRVFLDGLELDAADRVLAAGAETLAAKLDAVRVSDAAAAAAATPALVRQLGETLRDIRGEHEDVADALLRLLEPLRARP